MKLNILILLLLSVVSSYCQVKVHNKLHNVIHKPTDPETILPENLQDDEHNVLPTTMVVEKNGEPWTADDIKEKDQAVSSMLGYHNHCGRREGWVSLLSPHDLELQPDETQAPRKVIHARQVFVELDQQKIVFFANHNVNSVLQTIMLRDLDVPTLPKDWSRFSCLQLKLGNKELDKNWWKKEAPKEINQELEPDAIASFCVGDVAEIIHWAKDIWEYGRCALFNRDGVIIKPPGYDISEREKWSFNGSHSKYSKWSLQDSNYALNTYSQQLKNYQSELQKTVNSKTELERTHDIDEETKNHIKQIDQDKEETESIISSESTRILEMVNVGMKKQTEQRRELDEESSELEIEAQRMRDEKDCLDKMLQTQKSAEMLLVDGEIQTEAQKKVTRSLSKAEAAIQAEQEKEAAKVLEVHKQDMAAMKAQMTETKKQMLKEQLAASKNFYAQPLCNKTGKISNTFFVNDMCGKIMRFLDQQNDQESFDSKCTQEDHFCDACCASFIGSTLLVERENCQKDCNSAMGKPTEFRFKQRRHHLRKKI